MGIESTVKQFVDSLLTSKSRHVLCLNIDDASVAVDQVALEHLRAKGASGLAEHKEPTPAAFAEALQMIAGRHLVVSFADLEKHKKCKELIAEHAKASDPGGKLVVVSPRWGADTSEGERALRKNCLFYEKKPAPPPKAR
jgi:hypothetical protein